METSVIDLLVPTDIQVDDIDNNTSKITLEPLERVKQYLHFFE